MKVSTIILSHYKEREKNLEIIIDDLLLGSVKPDEIIVVIDNPEIVFDNNSVKIVRFNHAVSCDVRFSIALLTRSDYILMIDDDLSVKKNTLSNFIDYAEEWPGALLGLEGNVLARTDNPYTDGVSIDRGRNTKDVDIIIRTYFAPRSCLAAPLKLRATFDFPEKSIDDILLCLGNKYVERGDNMVIPCDGTSDMKELSAGGRGQCLSPEHYLNRNKVCKELLGI